MISRRIEAAGGTCQPGSKGGGPSLLHGSAGGNCSGRLLAAKSTIRAACLRYGPDVWSLAAQAANPYELVPAVAAAPAMNRAFFKMAELAARFPGLVPPAGASAPRGAFRSAHLCEGPGGFIQATAALRDGLLGRHLEGGGGSDAPDGLRPTKRARAAEHLAAEHLEAAGKVSRGSGEPDGLVPAGGAAGGRHVAGLGIGALAPLPLEEGALKTLSPHGCGLDQWFAITLRPRGAKPASLGGSGGGGGRRRRCKERLGSSGPPGLAARRLPGGDSAERQAPPPFAPAAAATPAAAAAVEGHIHHGADGSGDITRPGNAESFAALVAERTGGALARLVTADGAFDVSDDFGAQEERHARLVDCQLRAAFLVQAPGGALVLKLFDCFLPSSAAALAALADAYEDVRLLRLRTSRACNSERYAVARGFRGPGASAALSLARVPLSQSMVEHPAGAAAGTVCSGAVSTKDGSQSDGEGARGPAPAGTAGGGCGAPGRAAAPASEPPGHRDDVARLRCQVAAWPVASPELGCGAAATSNGTWEHAGLEGALRDFNAVVVEEQMVAIEEAVHLCRVIGEDVLPGGTPGRARALLQRRALLREEDGAVCRAIQLCAQLGIPVKQCYAPLQVSSLGPPVLTGTFPEKGLSRCRNEMTSQENCSK